MLKIARLLKQLINPTLCEVDFILKGVHFEPNILIHVDIAAHTCIGTAFLLMNTIKYVYQHTGA